MTLIYVLLGLALATLILTIVGRIITPDPPADLSDETIRRLVQRGDRKRAIDWYHQLHGGDIREAKAAVDNMIKQL